MEPFENIQLSFKCPKAFSELQPCNGGWHCDSCDKIVRDFRGMSETEIRDIFIKSGQTLCGMYDANRIKVLPQKPKWQRWASVAMLALGVTAFHDTVHAQIQPTKKFDKEAIINSTKDITVLGVFGVAIEIKPSFPGGEAAFKKYVYQHLKNPDRFQEKASAQIMVAGDGSITNVKILTSAGKLLDYEIINLLKNSPKWKPGIHNGKPYGTTYTLPIDFSEIQ